ncbi:hypothetical protein PINS_up000672 [Pythium insidiosum]|nr:hypothetical protein PINS_up000672 [Pythium insidiosum]
MMPNTTPIRSYRLRETPAELQQRERVLSKLREVLQEYALHEGCLVGMSEEDAVSKLVQLRTFGSYRLGVHAPEADIDTLCIAPRHCTRTSFFQKVPILLEATAGVKHLHVISDAFVPVIKFKLMGFAVDLLFVALSMDSIPSDLNILDDQLLRDLDEQSVRSLNGVRVTERIIQLVPNGDHFRTTLTIVKHWARVRGIYSNVLGFLGGVNWAILVARVCQLYPNALPATLLGKFFRVYHLWSWPNPVLLDNVVNSPNMGFTVWNPMTNPRDRSHLMPIITPAYPSMNSSYNVLPCTLRMIRAEFNRAASRTFEIETKKAPWGALFAKPTFFNRWNHFLRVQITARDASSLSNWLAWVESRLRYLLQRLEGVPNLRPHPLARFMDVEESDGDVKSSWFFIALSFHAPSSAALERPVHGGLQVDLTSAIQDFARQVEQWEHRRGGMDLEVSHVLRAEVPVWVVECVDGMVRKETGKDKSRRNETCPTDDSTPHSRVSNSPVKRAKESPTEKR